MQKKKEEDIYLLRRRDPMSFMLMLGLVSIGLTFLSFVCTMLYLSWRKDVSWQQGTMPAVFWLSIILIGCSSYTIEQVGKFAKQDNFLAYRRMLSATMLLGLAFIFCQLWGWRVLQAHGVYLKGGILGGFLYILSGLHVLHVLGGLFFLGWRWRVAYRNKAYLDAYIYNINPPNQFKWTLLVRYWHFIGIVWVMLFLFFLFKGFKTF